MLNGHAERLKTIPSLKEVQQALVEMQDKDKDFVGSSQWIGAFEVSLAINFFTDGFDCKILNVTQGSLLSEQGPTLKEHFLTHGTPVMIGGDVYAHTILGVDVQDVE